MSCRGICEIKNGKYYLFKNYGNGQDISISFTPNSSMIMELNDGDKIEFRVHKDLRKDSSVLYDGSLVKLDRAKYGYKYELEDLPREKLDHTGTYLFWTIYEDAEGTGDFGDCLPQIGEWLEVRLHVTERIK